VSDILEFANSIKGFYRKSAVDQLLALAWFCEVRRQRQHFDGALLRQCFREAGAEAPDMSVYLARLSAKKPPQIIKHNAGYRLAGGIRRDLDKILDINPTTVAVVKTLAELPSQIPDLSERDFLIEALNCYRVKSYRATIIMIWNLAYDHLARWVYADAIRLKAMNDGITSKYPKKSLVLVKVEDLDELKESEFIEAARVARLFDKNTTQILKDKLNRRNMAAHPSRVAFSQSQADDMITDLVTNVILKFI
jgi:hypothetical protein